MEEREERDEDETMEETGALKPSTKVTGDLVEEKIQELLNGDGADFDAWISFIFDIAKTSLNDVDRICKAYDAFLSEFPLCYGYWNKYASYMANHLSLSEVEIVYERAVKVVPYSVDLWVSYCTFGKLAYEDPADVRRLFQRGLSFVGKDYSSHLLWDKYIEFEYFQRHWSRLAYVFINTLRFPTKKLDYYYKSFKNFAGLWAKAVGYENTSIESRSDSENTEAKACEHADMMNVISSLQNDDYNIPIHNIIKYFISAGELFYQNSSQLDKKINSYEALIKRPYFHVKPLDDCQLKNWHQYLDFVELQGDFDWTIKLYERCLLPCANYSDFWIRYVEFAEAKGGREIANHALDRAQNVFFKRVPAFHLYCSMFKEKIGDVNGARAHFLRQEVDLDPEFIENVNREANMEKRMGNTEAAYMVYEKAVELAKAKGNLQILSTLYTKFARFTYVVSGNIDASIEVFMRGVQQVPCKSIIQEMINFIIFCGGPGQIPKIDSIIANTIAPDSAISLNLSSHECQDISNLILEFVDLHGNIHEIRKAWERHLKLFPHPMKPITRSQYNPIGAIDHNGSRIYLSDCHKSPENSHHSPQQEAMITNTMEGDINVSKETEEAQECDEAAEKQSIPERTELHKETREEPSHECLVAQISERTSAWPKVDSKVQTCSEQSLSLENHSISYPDNPPRESNPAASPHPNNFQEVIPSPNHNINQHISGPENSLHDDSNGNEVSATHVSGPIEVKPSTPSQDIQDNDKSNAAVQMQAHTHSDMHQSLPVSNVAHTQNASSAGNWAQMIYAQPSQSQQWQVHPYYSQGNHTCPIGNLTWPGLSAQQQEAAYAYMQLPQSGAQPQVQSQRNQQTLQSNEQQQYVYVQNGQQIPPHLWHYYQQQYYYLLQQQQIQSQQLQDSSQKEQMNPQKLPHVNPNPNQQIFSQQQQQQMSPQQPPNPNANLSLNPNTIPNQQISNQQQQQQQLAQYREQQNQHYQMLLNMQQQQQQQQQQFYMQQQQQLYVQQQQILQQPQFQQLTQQQQQLLLQQQQHLLLQQQQKQLLELQQQHQLQLLQLQQQQDPKTLSSNCIQQTLQVQHVSKQDEHECSEQAITPQCEGDKLQTSGQSGPSMSPQAETPLNQ